MDFKTYLNQSWNDHATQSEKLANEFLLSKDLVETNDQLSQFVGLVTHVMGEHLGRWEEGTGFLSQLRNHSALIKDTETERAILRSITALKIAGGHSDANLSAFDASNQVRILAVAASALSEKNTERAQELLQQALSLSNSLEKSDSAYRALAITGNNLACALEEKTSRSSKEIELMILAAQTARKNWERAGGWLEVSRAEYRLAMTYIKANDLVQALKHAESCLDLCINNQAEDMDMFFAYEAMALAGSKHSVTQAKLHFDKLTEDDKGWCEPSLKKLI